jgi:hypothetical protein
MMCFVVLKHDSLFSLLPKCLASSRTTAQEHDSI